MFTLLFVILLAAEEVYVLVGHCGKYPHLGFSSYHTYCMDVNLGLDAKPIEISGCLSDLQG